MDVSGDNQGPGTPSQLRVLYVSYGGGFLGGSEQSLLGLVDMVQGAGCRAWVCCNSHVLAEAVAEHGAEAIVMPVTALSPWGRFGHDLQEFRRAVAALRGVIRRVRPHVIHANTIWPTQMAVVAAMGRTPVICHVRGEVIRLGIELSLCRFASGVLAVSQHVADDLVRRLGQRRVETFYNPIECDDSADSPRTFAGDPAVVVVSRLSPEKGIDRALDVYDWLLRQGYTGELILIGDGSEMSSLRQQCERLGLNGRVQFRGFQDRPFAELPASSVLLVPSRREGFGRVVIEAALRGVPAIVCRTGGLPETVSFGQTGYIVDELESEDSRRRVLAILRDGAQLQTTSEKAIAFARSGFRLVDKTRQLLSVYNRVAKLQE
jgi:glycosyltransferase involved in cell wall biosynthesis